jgi:hypothetical protein
MLTAAEPGAARCRSASRGLQLARPARASQVGVVAAAPPRHGGCVPPLTMSARTCMLLLGLAAGCAGEVNAGGDTGGGGGGECLAATTPCADGAECCDGLACDTTSLGQVCCGNQGASCATENGEDCCGALLCVAGQCVAPAVCDAPCTEAPALVTEKERLTGIGGSFLGICGDANHTYGYHVPAARLPADDYSLRGDQNIPVCEWHAAAIDIGMDWPASRDWLRWLIQEIQAGRMVGVPEVIGSYDGVDVRYWSDTTGWSTDGVPYQGEGHDTWTHVSIYRSTALEDHHVLAGWTASGGPP